MSVPARLGRDGVLEVVQLDLVAGEVEALQASARQITEQLAALEAALA
jgi:malate/lactate dehydrogenase